MGDFVDSTAAATVETEAACTRDVRVLVTGFGPFRSTTLNPSWETAKVLSKRGVRGTVPRHHRPDYDIKIDIEYVPVEYAYVVSALSYFHGMTVERPAIPADMVREAEEAGARYECVSSGRQRYDLVLHIGQGRAGGVHIETRAHQLGYRLLDAHAALPPIIEGEQHDGEQDDDEETKKESLAAGQEDDSHGPDEQFLSTVERAISLNRGFPTPSGAVRTRVRRNGGALNTLIDTKGLAETLSLACPNMSINSSVNAGRYICEFTYFGSLANAIAASHEQQPQQQHARPERRRTSDANETKVLFIHVPPKDDPLSIDDMVDVISKAIAKVAAEIVDSRGPA